MRFFEFRVTSARPSPRNTASLRRLLLLPFIPACNYVAGLEDHALREGASGPSISSWPDSNSSYCSDGTNKLECNPDKITDPGLRTQDSLIRYNLPGFEDPNPSDGILAAKDSVTGLTWYPLDAFKGDWITASEDCKTAFANPNLRLPTRFELISLMDYAKSEPRFGPDAFDQLPQGTYLTSSITKRYPNSDPLYPGQPQEVWMVNTGCASPSCAPDAQADSIQHTFRGYAMNTTYHAICVLESNSFKLNTEIAPPTDTNTQYWKDHRTGLTWTTKLAGTSNWRDALDHCLNKSVGGLSGFRLPSIKELVTLTDDTKAIAFLFPINAQETAFTLWSSTPYAAGPDMVYVVSSTAGSIQTQPTGLAYLKALCVRGPD